MKPFTLVLAYYDNPKMLRHHIKVWNGLPLDVRHNLHVRIVDDGSPRWPAKAEAEGIKAWNYGHGDGLGSFELYRMKVDVPWNQDACRNLAVKHAPTKWLLLTDMDHVVPLETWTRLMSGQLDPGQVYRFGRVSAPNLAPYKHHPNSWALTARMYWRCGGYDERLAGNYGTDGDFLIRVKRTAAIVDLPEVLIRYPREVVPDASTTTLERKRADEKDNIRRLVAARSNDANWRPLHFSFPYERVL